MFRNISKKGFKRSAKSTVDSRSSLPQVDTKTTVAVVPSGQEKSEWYAVEEVRMPKLISFLCRYTRGYETLATMLLIVNTYLTPYDVFFNVEDDWVAYLVYACDLVYNLDMVLRLTVEEWRHHTKARVLVFMYPYKLHYCFVDIVSLFPFYFFYYHIADTGGKLTISELNYLGYFQLLSLVRMYRIFLLLGEIKSVGLLYEMAIFVVVFAMYYLSFILAVAILYYILTKVDQLKYFLFTTDLEILDNSWARSFLGHYLVEEPYGFFLLTLNFATVVVTTVGYGDVTPYTETEMAVSILIMLIGAIFASGVFQSTITSLCLQLDGARFDLFHRLDGIKIALRKAKMGEFFIAKVEQYYKCLWTYREGVDRVLFLHLLPISFQEDVRYDICLEMFSKSYLFQGLDEAFLRSVSKIISIELYSPGMIVCRQGGYANKMFYIIQGECQAMSKHDTSKRAAILRAGSIIGETNLFFSSPYAVGVETRTCCQLMNIDKETLMGLLSKYKVELETLRTRCQSKIAAIYYFYEMKGDDPVCWVQVRDEAQTEYLSAQSKAFGTVKAKKSEEPTNFDRNPQWPMCSMRWGYSFNEKITEDVILDANEFVIFDYPCMDKGARKNHMIPYTTCVVPEILSSEMPLIQIWNVTIVICALVHCFCNPYCFAFNQVTTLEKFMCDASKWMEYVVAILYLLDVIVEILGSAPVEGLYYKFRDGLSTIKYNISFYLDILSAIPLVFFFEIPEFAEEALFILKLLNSIMKSLKLLKVFRYLNYMVNLHCKQIFWFRLVQTCLAIMYGTHFIACAVFLEACRVKGNEVRDCTGGDSTEASNWLHSYEANNDDDHISQTITARYLSANTPYLISFFFASATLTSAGFGDFTPQNESELMMVILFTLVGFFLINYYTSVLTSALSCVVKPKLEFQQKLVAVQTFMEYYDLPTSLKVRVVQFYELQQQVRHGINLPQGVEHILYDAPDYLKSDYLYTAYVLLLEGVPIFSKIESKYIIKMADTMRRFLIPPHVMFHYKGEVHRAMYIIQSGSCGVYDEDLDTPKHILEASCHFGIRDLLFGEPSHFNIRSLSYCYLYEITYDQLCEVFKEEQDLLDLFEDEKEARNDEIEALYNEYNRVERERCVDAITEIPSWNHFRPAKDNRGRQGRRFVEYKGFFDKFSCGKLFRWYLKAGTVHPVGTFAKCWACWMSLMSCCTVAFLFAETFMYLRSPKVRIFQWVIDVFFYVDVYVKLHWGYYESKSGLLVTHPLKTAGIYVFEGTFISDVVFCMPLELILFCYTSCTFLGYGESATWFTKLRWIRFIQVKRIPQSLSIAHGIFVNRPIILCLLFVFLTVVMCSVVGSVAVYIACPWMANDWQEGDEYRMPACSFDHWTNKKYHKEYEVSEDVLKNGMNRWVFGIYYVTQTLLVIGFGDMITLNASELYLLILMSIFGFVFMRCVIADMTAAEVDSDEVRFRYTDEMHTLMHILDKEKVSGKLRKCVHDHLINTWNLSKGLQPGTLFTDLHPALESDLFRCYVGDTLKKVAIFRHFAPNVIRSLCLYLKKLHFVKGERIMRFGNMEYEMNIIVSGRVWICDRCLQYGCTLKPGETFGESSMLSYNTRKYTAIAASPVELFQISRSDFDALVERYPNVSQELSKMLNHGERDYFEPKIYAFIDRIKELDREQRDKHIAILNAKSDEIRLIISTKENLCPEEAGESRAQRKNIVARLWSKFMSYGSDDDGLAFIYFVGRKNKSTGRYNIFPPLLHPNCGFIKIYYTCVYILCFICPAMAFFEFGFSENLFETFSIAGNPHYSVLTSPDEIILWWIHQVSLVFEYFLLSFIVIQFFIPYQTEQGYVKSFPAICFNYLFGISGIWLDLTASVPLFILPVTYHWYLKDKWFLSILILSCRLLRLVRYYSYYSSKSNDLSVSPFRLKVQLSVSSFLFLSHAIACMFYYVSECDDETNDCPCCRDESEVTDGRQFVYTWTQEFVKGREIATHDDELMEHWRWYIRSMYWVITVVSTTGFGDITPQNTHEMWIGIVCFFCSAFVLAIILSQFTAGMTTITKAHNTYLYQLKLLLKYLNNVGLSGTRLRQTNLYFNVLWQKCRGKMYHEATEILPTTLRMEVCNALFVDVLNKVYLFNINNPRFIRQVAGMVKHSIYLPGLCIVKEGDLGSSMYIVFRGYVSGLVSVTSKDAMQLKELYQVGDVFGKLPCLFSSEYYRKSYRAEVVTEVLELHSKDVIRLAASFPEFWRLLKDFIANTYDNRGQSDSIFSAQRARRRDIYDLGEEYQQKVKKEPASGKRGKTDDADKPHPSAKNVQSAKAKTDITKLPPTNSEIQTQIKPATGKTNLAHGKDRHKERNNRKTHGVIAPISFLYNEGHRLSDLQAELDAKSKSPKHTGEKSSKKGKKKKGKAESPTSTVNKKSKNAKSTKKEGTKVETKSASATSPKKGANRAASKKGETKTSPKTVASGTSAKKGTTESSPKKKTTGATENKDRTGDSASKKTGRDSPRQDATGTSTKKKTPVALVKKEESLMKKSPSTHTIKSKNGPGSAKGGSGKKTGEKGKVKEKTKIVHVAASKTNEGQSAKNSRTRTMGTTPKKDVGSGQSERDTRDDKKTISKRQSRSRAVGTEPTSKQNKKVGP